MKRSFIILFLIAICVNTVAQDNGSNIKSWNLGLYTINLPGDLDVDEKLMESSPGVIIRNLSTPDYYFQAMTFELDADFDTRERLIEECDIFEIDARELGIMGLSLGTSEPMLFVYTKTNTGYNIAIGVYPERNKGYGLFFYIQECRAKDISDKSHAFNVITSIRLNNEKK